MLCLLLIMSAMNNTRAYWGMLIRGPQDGSSVVENIQFNLIDGKIVGFNKKNGTDFLSNFYPSTIKFDGEFYPTVEHAYQSSKTLNLETRRLIKVAIAPGDAKKLGKSVQLRSDWNDVKLGIMKTLIRSKFENPFLRHMLLLTGDIELINENRWNDKFFGVTNGVGENWLGKILQEVRSQAQEDSDES